MSAKKLFEKLGYNESTPKYGNKEEYLLYEKVNGITTFIISFDLIGKNYACITHSIGAGGMRKFNNIEEHKAIHQQLIELGWL